MHETTDGGAEPEIALAILADGTHVIRRAKFVESHGLKPIVIKQNKPRPLVPIHSGPSRPSHKLQMRTEAASLPRK